ncbi:MAG: GDSL-type esterase/lipase family protein [Verrucomicrobiota bacterium]|nr:GDSL-type esterase/lipase family protein [Verrucomicrobiota bacterium]MEC8279962.1 GDSL-type esterase/lipase family protein [Verrucomicrobiota bacterium]
MNYKRLPFVALLLASNSLSAYDRADYPQAYEPDPARFASAIAEFQVTDAANPPPKGAIVCTGSSSMRMWHPRIKDDLLGLTLLPRGFGGSHYTDLIYHLEALVFKYQPRALLLYEGDNDANYGKTPERIFQDFKFLAEQCREQLPDLRLYIIGAKPSIARWAIAEQMQRSNAMILDYCRANLGFTYIDVWSQLLDGDGQARPELFMEDKLHLNSAGYDRWTAAIAPVLLGNEAALE